MSEAAGGLISLTVHPLGQSMVALLLALTLFRLRRTGLAWGIGAIGLGWLWLWSMPVFSDHVRAALENRYPELAAEQAPRAGAIVVLGGAFSHVSPAPYPEASSAVDRYWHGARLFHAGRGEVVILSGGRRAHRLPGMTEAEAGARFLVDMGIPEAALLLDGEALTTRENAVNVAAILEQQGIETFLLVTSALHMRRSEAAFRAVGLDPIPVATDFQVRPRARTRLRHWLPSAAALANSTRAMHEYVGYWAYRLRGWAERERAEG